MNKGQDAGPRHELADVAKAKPEARLFECLHQFGRHPSGERMRRAVDSSLQRHVVREILVAVSRGRPVGPDLAHVLPQRPRGFESRFPAGRPVPRGVMVSLEGDDTVAT